MKNGFAKLNDYQYGSGGDGRNEFLAASNKSLLDQNPTNDYSYLAHVGGHHGNYFKAVNIINVSGFVRDHKYKISILGYGSKDFTLEMSSIGRDVVMKSAEPRPIDSGEFLVEFFVKAKAANGLFILSAGESAKFRINNIVIDSYVSE